MLSFYERNVAIQLRWPHSASPTGATDGYLNLQRRLWQPDRSTSSCARHLHLQRWLRRKREGCGRGWRGGCRNRGSHHGHLLGDAWPHVRCHWGAHQCRSRRQGQGGTASWERHWWWGTNHADLRSCCRCNHHGGSSSRCPSWAARCICRH